jgi:hypothetical protein
MSDDDWREMGDQVCEILAQMFGKHRPLYEKQSKQCGVQLQQLAAAAIAAMVRERVERFGEPSTGSAQLRP